MSLFDKLIKKPLRFAASTLFGSKGRKVIDQYSPLIEQCVSFFLPELRKTDNDLGILANIDFQASIESWAKRQGVPNNLVDAFATAVLEKESKQ